MSEGGDNPQPKEFNVQKELRRQRVRQVLGGLKYAASIFVGASIGEHIGAYVEPTKPVTSVLSAIAGGLVGGIATHKISELVSAWKNKPSEDIPVQNGRDFLNSWIEDRKKDEKNEIV